MCGHVLPWRLFVLACVGSVLYVRVSGGFSLEDTSWAISARVRVWKVPILLITFGMILTWIRFFNVL